MSIGKEYEFYRLYLLNDDYFRCRNMEYPKNSNENWSAITARRLNDLRTEKGLSYQKLSEALSTKYGITISADSLNNYEVTAAKYHTKSCKNRGMRIEYLRCLADFYGVSTDYLLGLTDIKTSNPDISSAVQLTGLSQESVKHLYLLRQLGFEEILKTIDILIADNHLHNVSDTRSYRSIFDLLHFYFFYSNSGVKKQVFLNGTIVDRDSSNTIDLNAIELDDSIIENAVLAEVQQALISIKRNEHR